MLYQPDNNVPASFLLWFNDHLLRNGVAFQNVTGIFSPSDDQPIVDPNGITYNPWITPKQQWAYDSSIPGVVVPNGVYIDGSFSTNVKIAPDDGRVFIPNTTTVSSVSGYYSLKDFQVKVSSESEENILFGIDPTARFEDTTPNIASDVVGFPFVYLKYFPGESKAFGFGGFMMTTAQIRAVVVTDNSFLFDAINILYRDTAETTFAILQPNQFPFDEFGVLKTTGFGVSMTASYNYRQIIAPTFETEANSLYYIKSVKVSPFTETVNSKIAKDAVGGFIDFKIESLGYPKARFV